MAMTMAEAAKLATDQLVAGVIETIVKESPILAMLPWTEVVGNALAYNRENVAPSVSFYDVGDEWTEDTPTFSAITTKLKVLGGDADVDRFLQATRANVNDLRAEVTALKAKAWAHAFEDAFLYGNATTDPTTFDGLQLLVPAAQRTSLGTSATPAVLSLAKLDQAIDAVKPGRPDLILMSKACRRRISTYMRANSSPVAFQIDDFGHRTLSWDTIPIAVSDFISDTETIASGVYSAKTGAASTTIFCLRFGGDGLHGLHNGPVPQVDDIGPLATKDADRVRIKGYVSTALYSTVAISCIDGISTGAVTA
jgi:hypothetical protein